MRRGSMLLVVLVLPGCASVGALEKKAPTFVHTSKSALEYKKCAVPA